MGRKGAHSEKESTIPLERKAFEIVAMGSSAGGLQALTSVVSGLPHNFPAPVVIVQHLDPRHRSLMAELLGRRTPLRVKQAEQDELLEAGTVYFAPPNQHLLITTDHCLSLSQAPLVHFLRPSVDLLFESVAACFENRAIAVVLSGTGADGSMGIKAIKQMGGTVIAQDPAQSEFTGMPDSAIRTGMVDFVLPLDEIAGALVSLVMRGLVDE